MPNATDLFINEKYLGTAYAHQRIIPYIFNRLYIHIKAFVILILKYKCDSKRDRRITDIFDDVLHMIFRYNVDANTLWLCIISP